MSDGENVTKIYCGERGNNDALAAAIYAGNHGYRDNNDALYALLANQRNNDPLSAMAAMGGMNGQWNNPFIYLVWMMMAQRMWNQNGDNCSVQAQLDSLRTQMQDNQNTNAIMDALMGTKAQLGDLSTRLGCDFNTLSQSICDVRSAIQQVGGKIDFTAEKVINSVLAGRSDILNQVNTCCCNIRESIASLRSDLQLQLCQQTGELRNGQRDVLAAITQGFSSTAYQAQQDKCDLIRAGQDNTQRLVDLLNNHWSAEDKLKIQDLKFELSQERQTRQIESRDQAFLSKLIALINNNGGGCCGSSVNGGF